MCEQILTRGVGRDEAGLYLRDPVPPNLQVHQCRTPNMRHDASMPQDLLDDGCGVGHVTHLLLSQSLLVLLTAVSLKLGQHLHTHTHTTRIKWDTHAI